MSTIYPFCASLLLVMVANLAPWTVGRLLGTRWALPLDFGARLPDGSTLLGAHKTWRGALAAAISCAVLAWAMAYPWTLGLEVASLALAGDAASSFVKRRLRLPPGAEVAGLDQLPEALLPLLLLRASLGLSTEAALVIAVVFVCLDVTVTPWRHPSVGSRH